MKYDFRVFFRRYILAIAFVFALLWMVWDYFSAPCKLYAEPRPVPHGVVQVEKRPAPIKSGNVAQGDTVKIGIVASMTGELATWGVEAVKGAHLAVEEVNRRGGINGKRVELLVEDCASKPEQAKTAAERLVTKGVLGLVGEMPSGINMQIAHCSYESGVPMIASGGARPELTHKSSNVFRACFTTDFQGPAIAEFAYKELGLRRAAVFTDRKQPYSTSISASFKKKFKALGGTIVDEQFYESGQTQFAAQLTNIKTLRPDALFLGGYFTEVGAIARQARGVGIRATFLGGDGWDSPLLHCYGGRAIEKAYYVNHYANDDNRHEVYLFKKKWLQRYHNLHTSCVGALTYDALGIMIDALQRAKALDSKALTDALEQTRGYQGITGQITLLGCQGDPHKDGLIMQVTGRGAKFVKRCCYEEVMQKR
jgi:branched-chain amino acid transport system substrate-binding protein